MRGVKSELTKNYYYFQFILYFNVLNFKYTCTNSKGSHKMTGLK